MTERFVVTSPDGSRDTLYERRNALSRDLLGDQASGNAQQAPSGWRRRKRPSRHVGERSQKRIPELALGLVLVVGGALAATTLAGSDVARTDVVGVSRMIARGDTLKAGDLIAVKVDTKTARAFVSIRDAKSLIGRLATVDIAGGSPVAAGSLSQALSLNENESIVAVRVEVGDVPESIATGDQVRVAFVPDQTLVANSTVTEFSTTAIVWSVSEPSEAIQDYVVSLKVPKDFLVVSATAQRTKLAIVRQAEGSIE